MSSNPYSFLETKQSIYCVEYLNTLCKLIFSEMQRGKPWVLRLLVLSCLSIAAKMKNTPFSPSDFLVIRFPCPLNFMAPNCKVTENEFSMWTLSFRDTYTSIIPYSMKQREEGCIFDSLAINKMELLILNALGWRMRPVTPFPFLYFFLSFIQLKDPPMIHVLKCRASDIIFNATNGTSSMQYSSLYTSISLLFSLPGKIFKIQDVVCSHSLIAEIKLLEYKPSILAASALLSASYELFQLQFPSFKVSILSCKYVNKVSDTFTANLAQNLTWICHFLFRLSLFNIRSTVGCRKTCWSASMRCEKWWWQWKGTSQC